MSGTSHLDVDAILRLFDAAHDIEAENPDEGLRERKKRRVRQKISNVATAMFLVHGFENVTVARVAAVCEVSEQTVYNYFPTKESMFFDRSESMINAVSDAVRDRGSVSLAESVLQALGGGIQHGSQQRGLDEERQLQLVRLFCEVATESPALAAARLADFAHFTDEVSVALAHRIDANPTDPEVILATLVVAGLARVRLESTFHHVKSATSLRAVDEAVRRDVRRAAQLAEPTLTAFDDLRETARSTSRSKRAAN